MWRGSFFRKHALLEASPDLAAALAPALQAAAASSPTSPSSSADRSTSSDLSSEGGVKLTSFRQSLNPLHLAQTQGPSPPSGPPLPSESGGGARALQQLMVVLQAERERESEAGGAEWEHGWGHVSRLPDPVLLISRKNPHLILGASAAMGALLLGAGGRHEELLGLTLDSFVVPPPPDSGGGSGSGSPAERGEESTAGGAGTAGGGHHTPTRSALLKSFYKDMLLPDRAHLVATLQCLQLKVKCSVSSFPIHCFQADPDLAASSTQAAFAAYKDSIRDSDDWLQVANTTVAVTPSATATAATSAAGGSNGTGAGAGGESDDATGTGSSTGTGTGSSTGRSDSSSNRNSHQGGGGPGAHYFGLLFSRLDK